MTVGERKQTMGSKGYQTDALYAFSKAFTEAAQNILTEATLDLFTEPGKTINNAASREALREFFINDFVNEADETKSAEQIEDELNDVQEQFENDMNALSEAAYMSDYMPMIGMSLPIHKLILMNNVFSQGNVIQKVVAISPSFPITMERRLLIKPDGTEIDIFENQNMIADAIDSTAPVMQFELTLPETETTDIIGMLGGTVNDELSIETHVSGILVENVYIAEGDRLPDADGWYSSKGAIAKAEDAGLKDVWFRVNLPFKPSYGGTNRLDRTLSNPIEIVYKKDSAGTVETINDTLFGAMHANKITLTAVKGKVKKVRLAAKLNTSNANLEECSVRWKRDTDYVEIPEATPINTTVTPEEVKDLAASHDVNQVTKIMGITKTVLSEYKDMKIKRFLDADYDRLDERYSFQGEFDFAPNEGYALDWVTFRQATFMDYLDDLVTQMLQVWNDANMTVSIVGDPRIVRKLTPSEYTYQAPANIGPVVLDYTQTVVNTKDQRVYNFVGSDKFRNTNQLMLILNPRNSERICYRLYDYQMYISNEIRNAANPALPAIHSFERYKIMSYQAVQGRIDILHPSGRK